MAPEERTVHEIELDIGGMSCAECGFKVREALGVVPGVRAVGTNWEAGTARVQVVAGGPSHDELAKALDAIGYRLADVRPV